MQFEKPCTVLLLGEMGAGKTTFVSEVVKRLCGAHVTSPTFGIINQYAPDIFHADLYRIRDAKELENTDFYEILYGDNIFFIEWPFNQVDPAAYAKCKRVVKVHIKVVNETEREFTFD